MSEQPSSDFSQDQRLDEILAEYFQAVEGGQKPENDALVARYPEFAVELEEFFADKERFEQFAGQFQSAGSAEEPTIDPSESSALSPGTKVRYFGDYELLEEIARGGMGVVYKARQVSLNRVVALKMILSGQLASEEDVARFRTEAEAAANLQHPGIVAIHEVGEHEGQHYFSMDYVEGTSLNELVRDNPLSTDRAARYVRQIAEAIHYAHGQGTLHRDLKPSNVLIDTTDGVRVTDFGLAKRIEDDSSLTATGQVLGTPSYMPPEQAAGQLDQVKETADVYALGAILYELLTDRPPFKADTPLDTLTQVRDNEPAGPRLLNPKISRDLETICLKAMAKEPSRRYPTADALAADLRRYLNREPIQARPVGASERLWRWCRRNPLVASLTTAVAVSLLLGAGIASYFAVDARREAGRAREKETLAETKADEATGNLNLARRRLYISDMRLAQRAWGDLQIGRLVELLDGQRPEQTGGADYRGFEWYYWQRVRNSQLRSLEGHTAQVTSLAFSPDGTRMASGSADKTVKLWDTATGKEILTLAGHTGPVNCLVFNSDGTRIVATCKGVARVWDLPEGRETLNLQPGDWYTIASIAFSPDGKLLVAADGQVDVWPGFIRFWDATTGQQTLEPIETEDEGLLSVVVSPDGERLAAGSWNGEVKVWEMSSRQELLAFDTKNVVSSLLFTPDSQQIASGCTYMFGTLKVWDAASGKEVAKLESDAEWIQCLAFSPDGTRIATQSGDLDEAKEAKIWEVDRRRTVFSLKLPGNESRPVAFSPDLRQMAAAWGQRVKIWDATGNPEVVACGRGGDEIHFSQDDRRLLSAHRDGTVRVWDTANGQELIRLGQETPSGDTDTSVEGVAFGPGEKWLAAAQGFEVVLWDLHSEEKLLTWKEPDVADEDDTYNCRHVGSVAVSPDGKWLALAFPAHMPGVPGEVRVFRVPTALGADRKLGQARRGSPDPAETTDRKSPGSSGDLRSTPVARSETGHNLTLVLVLKGFEGAVTSVTFSPCGRYLASASYDGIVRIWDVPLVVSMSADQQEADLDQDQIDKLLAGQARMLAGHQDGVMDVVYSSDGKLLASASSDATVRIWDPTTGRQIRVLRGHTKGVDFVAFNPDGKQVASSAGSFTTESKVWDVASGQELLTLKDRGGPVAFSHGGKRLAVGGTILDARPLTDEICLQREATSLYRHALQTPLRDEEIAKRAIYREDTGLYGYELHTPLFREDVVERIRHDATVSDAVRQQALRMAEHFRSDHRRLRKASWAVLRRSGLTAEDYREAIPWVEAESREHPDKGDHLIKLGVTQYRAGDYQKALATLERVYDLIPEKDEPEEYGKYYGKMVDGEVVEITEAEADDESIEGWSIPDLPKGMDLWAIPADLAFLAMTKCQMGRKDEAREHLEELRDYMETFKEYWEEDYGQEDPRPFAQEAEAVFQGDVDSRKVESPDPKSETDPINE